MVSNCIVIPQSKKAYWKDYNAGEMELYLLRLFRPTSGNFWENLLQSKENEGVNYLNMQQPTSVILI